MYLLGDHGVIRDLRTPLRTCETTGIGVEPVDVVGLLVEDDEVLLHKSRSHLQCRATRSEIRIALDSTLLTRVVRAIKRGPKLTRVACGIYESVNEAFSPQFDIGMPLYLHQHMLAIYNLFREDVTKVESQGTSSFVFVY